MALTEVDVARLNDDVFAATGPNKNRIINGDMRIDQRNVGAAVLNANGYIVDRFLSNYFGSGTGRWTASQSTDAPSGFTNSFTVTVTTTDASPSATFAYNIANHRIEGFNVADLAWGTASAKTVTVSFWTKSSVTGSFPLVLNNSAGTRGYGTLYTVAAANTWEYKTITIPGDTSGTWLTDEGIGIMLCWGAGGANRTLTADTWSTTASTPTTVSGAVNLLATNGATLYLTGVQLEVGDTATPFEHRLIGAEIALCQRYYIASQFSIQGNALSGGYVGGWIQFPTAMRATPTAAVSTVAKFPISLPDPQVGTTESQGIRINVLNNTGFNQPNVSIGSAYTADAEL